MLRLSGQQCDELRDAVVAASARPEVRRAVQSVYVALQDAIDLRRPLCVQSGRCCRFDEYGHKLFVTTMELSTFVHDVDSKARPSGPALSQEGCPFQRDKLCSVHSIRPFGCRIFFCDATAQNWQQDQYARFHAELRRLHEELAVPYFYVEWRVALRVIEVANATYPPVSSADSL